MHGAVTWTRVSEAVPPGGNRRADVRFEHGAEKHGAKDKVKTQHRECRDDAEQHPARTRAWPTPRNQRHLERKDRRRFLEAEPDRKQGRIHQGAVTAAAIAVAHPDRDPRERAQRDPAVAPRRDPEDAFREERTQAEDERGETCGELAVAAELPRPAGHEECDQRNIHEMHGEVERVPAGVARAAQLVVQRKACDEHRAQERAFAEIGRDEFAPRLAPERARVRRLVRAAEIGPVVPEPEAAKPGSVEGRGRHHRHDHGPCREKSTHGAWRRARGSRD